jgi:hypothetical protein
MPIYRFLDTLWKMRAPASAVNFPPTKGRRVSLLQRGQELCKAPYEKEKPQAQFHEIKDETFWRILSEGHAFTQPTVEPM